MMFQKNIGRSIWMSENKRSKQEYIERFANDWCEGDIERAKENAIVKEVLKQLEGDADGSKEVFESN